jgi:hypothetical protein
VRDLGSPQAKLGGRIAALACAAAVAGSALAGASPVAWGAGRGNRLLSSETTFTRWAHVNRTAGIHRAPRASAPRIGRLAWHTADGFSSIYLVLRAPGPRTA